MHSFMKFLKGLTPSNQLQLPAKPKNRSLPTTPKTPHHDTPFTTSSLSPKSTTIPTYEAVTYPISSSPEHLNMHLQAKEPSPTHFLVWCLLSLFNPHIRRRQWHPTPILLPRKSHGQRSLVGSSPWNC